MIFCVTDSELQKLISGWTFLLCLNAFVDWCHKKN